MNGIAVRRDFAPARGRIRQAILQGIALGDSPPTRGGIGVSRFLQRNRRPADFAENRAGSRTRRARSPAAAQGPGNRRVENSWPGRSGMVLCGRWLTNSQTSCCIDPEGPKRVSRWWDAACRRLSSRRYRSDRRSERRHPVAASSTGPRPAKKKKKKKQKPREARRSKIKRPQWRSSAVRG